MAGTMEFAGMRMYEEYSLKWEMETEMWNILDNRKMNGKIPLAQSLPRWHP
jgi:hypothetical protein